MPLNFGGTNVAAITFVSGGNTYTIETLVYNGTVVWTAGVNYFTNGTQNVAWTTGYSTGAYGSALLLSDSMYLEAGYAGTTTNERALRTTNTVDLTSINTLYCEVAVNTTGTSQAFSFIASTSATGSASTYNARTQVLAGFGDTQVISLNVSGLTGNYYIRVHQRDGSTSSTTGSDATITRIWGV